MFATKLNRVENMRLLMECKVPADASDNDWYENEGDDIDMDKDTTEDAGEAPMRPRINIDGKDRNTLTALHHAAKRGFTVKPYYIKFFFSNFDIL